jgi:hypothetical protein
MASRLEGPLPSGWQEVPHTAENGERHRADVKTATGLVLEFQHSFLNPHERGAREAFYSKMVWVVDGLRRIRDRAQFFVSLGRPIYMFSAPPMFAPTPFFWAPSNEGALLRDWKSSRVPVYFDFGDSGQGDKPILWRRHPCGRDGEAYLSPVQKALFLRVHAEGHRFEAECTQIVERTVDRLMQLASRPEPLRGFEQYLARRQRARRRF